MNATTLIEADSFASSEATDAFVVMLDEFEGPFDVLLSLIAKHRLDVTALALHTVTDDFVTYIKDRGDDWSLDEATQFLVIAATLLDLKAARLLPGGEVEDEEDIAVLEARDMLLARLLQYRAFKQSSIDLRALMEIAGRIAPRRVGMEPRFTQLLPEVEIYISPDDLANLAARALEPRLPPVISVAHLHAARVSVREQAAILVDRLRRAGHSTFSALTRDCDTTLLVVARFLALLEIYRDGSVLFDQPVPLGELHVRWIGDDTSEFRHEIDEFDTTEIQEFRDQISGSDELSSADFGIAASADVNTDEEVLDALESSDDDPSQ